MTTKENLPEKAKRDVFDAVLEKIKTLDQSDLELPKNYHAGNTVKAARLILEGMTVKRDNMQVPVLQLADRSSVGKALLKMVMHGLDPMLNQCYFILYGNELQLQRSYFGTMSLARRIAGVKMVYAEVIYKGDVFEYEINAETGKKHITKHEQKLGNISHDASNILGAYAVIHFEGGEKFTEIMTMPQIRLAWEQGTNKGGSKPHKNFPDQMAKKTVIYRGLKPFLSSSIEGYYEEDIDASKNDDLDPKLEVKRETVSLDEPDEHQDVTMLDGPEDIEPYVVDTEPRKVPKEQPGMFDDNEGPGF